MMSPYPAVADAVTILGNVAIDTPVLIQRDAKGAVETHSACRGAGPYVR